VEQNREAGFRRGKSEHADDTGGFPHGEMSSDGEIKLPGWDMKVKVGTWYASSQKGAGGGNARETRERIGSPAQKRGKSSRFV